jgi:hypothetical protein
MSLCSVSEGTKVSLKTHLAAICDYLVARVNASLKMSEKMMKIFNFSGDRFPNEPDEVPTSQNVFTSLLTTSPNKLDCLSQENFIRASVIPDAFKCKTCYGQTL